MYVGVCYVIMSGVNATMSRGLISWDHDHKQCKWGSRLYIHLLEIYFPSIMHMRSNIAFAWEWYFFTPILGSVSHQLGSNFVFSMISILLPRSLHGCYLIQSIDTCILVRMHCRMYTMFVYYVCIPCVCIPIRLQIMIHTEKNGLTQFVKIVQIHKNMYISKIFNKSISIAVSVFIRRCQLFLKSSNQ